MKNMLAWLLNSVLSAGSKEPKRFEVASGLKELSAYAVRYELLEIDLELKLAAAAAVKAKVEQLSKKKAGGQMDHAVAHDLALRHSVVSAEVNELTGKLDGVRRSLDLIKSEQREIEDTYARLCAEAAGQSAFFGDKLVTSA